jgi:phenylpropionate dioxygenase-like ring-hydroxylating dioxygenase large terminal subunit
MYSVERQHWHPVAACADVGAAPLAALLLTQPLVLWRDASGTIQAWADQCPHRGARLSLGRVCQGRLECPYHGWQFEASGQCVQVPALPAFTPPASYQAQVFQTREQVGLVWVRLDSAGSAGSAESGAAPALPKFDAEADAELHKLNCGPYEVATSAGRIVENFLDLAHFGFIHEGWLGMRQLPDGALGQATEIPAYQVEATPQGLRATGCRAWQPRSSVHATAAALIDYSYEVTAPFAAVLTKVPPAHSVALPAFRESIALFICPLTPDTCRVWFRLAVADAAPDEAALRAFQDTIFLQDKPVLESQSPRLLPLAPRAELHTAADKTSVAYRRYLSQLGITFGVC